MNIARSQYARGPHPEDAAAFGPDALSVLQTATAEVGWLRDRGYASKAAGTLVGDHHQLTLRQRRAVMRCACGPIAAENRAKSQRPPSEIRGQRLHIDGFNVLLTIDTAIAAGLLLLGQDGCIRDMASLNGRFPKSELTTQVLLAISEALEPLEPSLVIWYFDRPVPFSGQIAAEVGQVDPSWQVQLVDDPDPILKDVDGLVATADGAILEASQWVNLARYIAEPLAHDGQIIDLSGRA